MKYIVGCQVDITGLEGGLNASIDSSLSLGLDGSLTFPLAPGEAAFVPLGTKTFEGGVASVQYKRQGIEVQQCGGYAQARAFTTVQTEGNYVIKSTLYGAPFSLN